MANKLEIGPAEAGQQLLRFLEKRLLLPRALAYKWLRTGQARVNGKRCKADQLLEAGDVLRLPPWAPLTGESGGAALQPCSLEPGALGPDVELVFQNDDILVLNKPFGLPVHGGTRHKDSLAARLKAACGQGFYLPAPAHRLDLHASGLLLAGKTHSAQTRLHGLFRESKAELEREYLCWARGNAGETFAEPLLCVDLLSEERDAKGRERAAVVQEGGQEARAFYHCIEVRKHAEYGALSLIRARLLTGRKHQIRAQLAARGFPLLGDWRYGGGKGVSIMLHASRLKIPAGGGLPELVFVLPPVWSGFFSIGDPDA